MQVNTSINPDQKFLDWAFLVGNSITETKQDIIETPEPTSIEFEDDFRRLMRTALPNDSKRRTMIVLDNLDRVDHKDALSIWTTLQTFLQDRHTNPEPWCNKIWIIVPYDPSGLRKLWDTRVFNKNSSSENVVDKIVSDSFIDKIFQLRFEVPPPVLSNWKAYLFKLIADALPRHDVDDQHTIYRVFNYEKAKNGETPTPRELKLYVNQIGAIHRQWQHTFPIGHIAYYAILRRANTDIQKELLKGSIPDANVVSMLSANLRPNLAGLALNVPAAFAQQLLLGDPIYNALVSNNVKEIKNLERHHSDGFWAVLEEVATSQLFDTGATAVANTALCLHQSEIINNQTRNEVQTVKSRLSLAASSIINWSPLDENLANGIVSVCRIISDPAFSKTVIANLRQSLKEQNMKDGILVFDIIPALFNIIEHIDGIGHQEAIAEPFSLPVDASKWGTACSQIVEQKQKYWPLFKPLAQFEDISNFLMTSVLNGQFSENDLATIYVTQASPILCDWDYLAAAFEQRLLARQKTQVDQVNRLLQGLSLLRQFNCVHANVVTKRLVDDGHLSYHLHLAQVKEYVESKALCIVTILEQLPDAAVLPPAVNSETDYNDINDLLKTDNIELAKRIIKILKKQNNTKLLFTITDKRKQYDPLIIRCLRLVADTEPEILYTPEVINKRWSMLQGILHEDEKIDRLDKLIALCGSSSPTK